MSDEQPDKRQPYKYYRIVHEETLYRAASLGHPFERYDGDGVWSRVILSEQDWDHLVEIPQPGVPDPEPSNGPRPENRNAAEVLKELGLTGRSTDHQKKVIAREAWRLSPIEVSWLNAAGLTDLTFEVAELMAKGWSEASAREAIAVKHAAE